MSKIEEALKKARLRDLTSTSNVSKDNSCKITAIKDLVEQPNKPVKTLSRNSITKEIALMSDGELLDNEQLAELGIIWPEMSNSELANSYRDLRTKLIQKSRGENFIVMITSCHSDDDGSHLALNLAAAFTFDESKTSLLIDCNLRNPQLDNKLNLKTTLGLTDYLKDQHIDIESIVHSTGIKRLRMIPAGTYRESATEYFTSLKMRELMGGLLSRYSDRYIFVSSAPVKDSADTRILIELCDFVILMVPYARASKSSIKAATDAICQDKFLGVVFSDTPKMPAFSLAKT
jgi:Mrp family chromosome partitioning ATPase